MSPDLNKENFYLPTKNQSQCVTAAKDSYNGSSNFNGAKGNNLKANSEAKGGVGKEKDCESFLGTLLSDDGGGKGRVDSGRGR